MTGIKTVLIIDDHPLFREGIKAIIAHDQRYSIVAEAGEGADGVRLAMEIRPTLVLVDLTLPDTSGLEVIRRLSEILPEVGILVISMHSKIDVIAECFRAGALGYIIKESTAGRLLTALEAVGRGEQYLDSSLSPRVLLKLSEYSSRKAQMKDSAYNTLTQREQQILRLLAEGLTTTAVGQKLFITRKTVENHRANIINKLGIPNLAGLVRYAIRLGLVDVDQGEEIRGEEGSSAIRRMSLASRVNPAKFPSEA